MSPETVMTIGRQAIELAFLITSALLIPALIIGLLISMFQAATQINEMTLSFVPKLIVIFAVLVAAGPWIISQLVNYTRQLFEDIPNIIG